MRGVHHEPIQETGQEADDRDQRECDPDDRLEGRENRKHDETQHPGRENDERASREEEMVKH